jgi:hypothetical protein
MSRSYKKTPKGSNCSSLGQKHFKECEHRAERKSINDRLKNFIENQIDLESDFKKIYNENKWMLYEEYLPHSKEYGNEWASPRDGKHWFGDLINYKDYKKWLRK